MDSKVNSIIDDFDSVFIRFNDVIDISDEIWQGSSKDNMITLVDDSLKDLSTVIYKQLEQLDYAIFTFNTYKEKKRQLEILNMEYNDLVATNDEEDSNGGEITRVSIQIDTLNKEIAALKEKIISILSGIVNNFESNSKSSEGTTANSGGTDVLDSDITNSYEVDEKGIVIKNDGLPRNATVAEKNAYLFTNGVAPSTISAAKAEGAKNVIPVEVEIINEAGERTTMSLNVHKALEEDVKEIFSEIADTGFKIKASSTGSYVVRNINGTNRLSHHSYGTAIDINWGDNSDLSGTKTRDGSSIDPENNEYAITNDIANIFRKYGWCWGGGDWGDTSNDYMHFSFTEINSPGVK